MSLNPEIKQDFDTWMEEVDSIICDQLGIGSEDLSDQLWLEWFLSGKSSLEAAAEALTNDGYDIELDF